MLSCANLCNTDLDLVPLEVTMLIVLYVTFSKQMKSYKISFMTTFYSKLVNEIMKVFYCICTGKKR